MNNTISTTATQSSTISYYLDKLKEDMMGFSQEHNISTTLMFCVIKEWAVNNLETPID